MKRIISLFILNYFRWLAQLQLKKNQPIIIGITGSAGKTSTLQACEAVLSPHFSIKVSHKANSESGIPLDILGLHPENFSFLSWLYLAIKAPFQLLLYWPRYQIYVVEMGIDSPYEPKNMSYLLKILQPNVGVLLNAGAVHAEPFDHLIFETEPEKRKHALIKLIANEKGKLLTSLPKSGFAIANADDSAVVAQLKNVKAHQLTFGKSAHSKVRIRSIHWTINSTMFEYTYDGESVKIEIKEHILPEMYAYSFAAALASGISQGLSLITAAHSLTEGFLLPPGRSSLIPAINHATIIDSSYNASTQPTLDMLRLLKKVAGQRKLALLGDMREIGTMAAHEHLLVALAAAETCDRVYLVGPLTKEHILPVLKHKHIPAFWFSNAHQAAQELKNELKKNDILLVKGSQNTLLLETAVEELMAEPEKANQLLCRRGSYWNERRKALLTDQPQ